MENQHRKITGYRDLSQAEIDLMNRVKAQGVAMQALVVEVNSHLQAQRAASTASSDVYRAPLSQEAQAALQAEQLRLAIAEPQRWASIARTHFQEGLMALTRAVAQPTSF